MSIVSSKLEASIERGKIHVKSLIADYQYFGSKLLIVRFVNLVAPVATIRSRSVKFFHKCIGYYVRRIGYVPPLISNFLPNPTGVRRFIKPELKISGTFSLLNERKVRYVILRWYEQLPQWPKGEDIDILIHDDDLHLVKDLFVWKSNCEPVDIYTVSARLGWNNLPYYPPSHARALLERRQLFKGNFYIPHYTDQFPSLAYHIVLRKGLLSGLNANDRTQNPVIGEHDYAEVLSAKRRVEDTVSLNLESLSQYLEEQKWMPAVDTMYKYAELNSWLRSQMEYSPPSPEAGETVVFVIRQGANKRHLVERITHLINDDNRKFEPILLHRLNSAEQHKASELLRGGEWGKGVFNTSGGEPDFFYIGFNYFPQHSKLTENGPPVSDCYIVKHRIRKKINRCQPFWRSANLLHTPDNLYEAEDYINRCLDNDTKLFLNDSLRLHIQRCNSSSDIVLQKLANHGRRAKIEVIDLKGEEAVKKTFKVGEEKFLNRELRAYKLLHGKTQLLPELKKTGDGFFITEKLFPVSSDQSLAEFRETVIEFLRLVYELGYFLVDFLPQNICLDKNGNLKVIDYEFMQEYKIKPSCFLNSYDIVGVPKNMPEIDLPFGYKHQKDAFLGAWGKLLNCDVTDLR